MRFLQLSLRARGWLVIVMFVLLFQGGLMPWALAYFMLPSALPQPDPAQGFTSPYNNHGTIVYLQPWETFLVKEGMIAGFLGFGILIFLAVTQREIG